MTPTPLFSIVHNKDLCGKPDIPNDTPRAAVVANPAHCLCCEAVMVMKECTSLVMEELGMYVLECPNCPSEPPADQEPTPDQIATAINGMLAVLQILDRITTSSRKDMPKVPFAKNVQEALTAYDKPEIRSSLADRLYHPERYVSKT
jgi:hypothetical protein